MDDKEFFISILERDLELAEFITELEKEIRESED